jgi:hypothetical protein
VPNAFSNPHYLYATNHPDWNNTMLWATYGSPIVTPSQMQNGIDNFIINMKLQNCVIDTALAKLLNMCANTGIQNIEKINRIKVYPNPFTGKIQIEYNMNDAYYELLNSAGEIIWNGKEISEKDFTSLTDGLYFLRIHNSHSSNTIKLIKN